MFPKFFGLSQTTLHHFNEIFTNKTEEERNQLLQQLGIIQSVEKRWYGTQFIATKPRTISFSTSFDQTNALTFSVIGGMNNFLQSGINGNISMSTKLKGKKLTIPKLHFGLKLPYYTQNDLHLFEIENGECEYEESFPFKHKEKVNSMKLKYTRSNLKIQIEQNCHNTTAEADESLRYIPRNIIDGSDEMEYVVDVEYEKKYQKKWFDWKATLQSCVGIFKENLYFKPAIQAMIKTHEWKNIWFSSHFFGGFVFSQNTIPLSQYFYLGAPNLRGYKTRGCQGQSGVPHLGGNLIGTIHQFVHYRLPFGQNTSLFGFINFGLCSFKKINAQQSIDCKNSSCGFGFSMNNIDFNFCVPLLKSSQSKDNHTKFQLSTTF